VERSNKIGVEIHNILDVMTPTTELSRTIPTPQQNIHTPEQTSKKSACNTVITVYIVLEQTKNESNKCASCVVFSESIVVE
jgi:hypothetical protein